MIRSRSSMTEHPAVDRKDAGLVPAVTATFISYSGTVKVYTNGKIMVDDVEVVRPIPFFTSLSQFDKWVQSTKAGSLAQ